jgi:hypothetical protein
MSKVEDALAVVLLYMQQIRSLLHVCINFHDDQQQTFTRRGWSLKDRHAGLNNLQLKSLEVGQRKALSMEYFGKDYSGEQDPDPSHI